MRFAFPIARVVDAVTPATRVIYLVDPNNPTGLPLPDGAAEAVAGAASRALVFVDEAYADFSGRTLVGTALERHANLIVGRTFAKGHGLAGLRVVAVKAIQESDATSNPPRPQPARADAYGAAASPPPVEPGTQEIATQVTVTYVME